ncbi:hypothetical protein B0O80DRAFT_75155 [Mortierella sp. GBAus27b]|nr:hypothetical protein B0O80DRAFT_75155 [Mortierella sp. GBAus27b]
MCIHSTPALASHTAQLCPTLHTLALDHHISRTHARTHALAHTYTYTHTYTYADARSNLALFCVSTKTQKRAYHSARVSCSCSCSCSHFLHVFKKVPKSSKMQHALLCISHRAFFPPPLPTPISRLWRRRQGPLFLMDTDQLYAGLLWSSNGLPSAFFSLPRTSIGSQLLQIIEHRGERRSEGEDKQYTGLSPMSSSHQLSLFLQWCCGNVDVSVREDVGGKEGGNQAAWCARAVWL